MLARAGRAGADCAPQAQWGWPKPGWPKPWDPSHLQGNHIGVWDANLPSVALVGDTSLDNDRKTTLWYLLKLLIKATVDYERYYQLR